MNWMTSGRHRALYSQRGRRRQMRFPSQGHRQRIQPSSPPQGSQQPTARDLATPWYIVPVGNDEESHDIRVLALERKGALRAAEGSAEQILAPKGPSSVSRKNDREHEHDRQGGRKETRCIFTPVKKARKYSHPPNTARVGKASASVDARPPSSIASGVDMRFFNDGKELLPQSKSQWTKDTGADQVLRDTLTRPASRPIDDDGDQAKLQLRNSCPFSRKVHSREGEAHKQSLDSEIDGYRDCLTSARELDQRDAHYRNVSSTMHDDSDPATACCAPEGVPFNAPHDSFYDVPPSSPVEASPLSFKMSRAEVLQSQSSHQLRRAPSFTPSPPAPSPSTSTSSQGSLMRGRPPQGWQKKLLLAQEHLIDPLATSSRVPTLVYEKEDVGSTELENALQASTPSSSKSNDADSISDTVIPIDAKERIMAIASSQSLLGESQKQCQQVPTMNTRPDDSTVNMNLSGKSMTFHQSWVMSSRTRRILDEASTLKHPFVGNATNHRDTKYLEMESVAIYMYTLVQCYKCDEKLRPLLHQIQQS